VYQNFIPYLNEARHVSGDTPPIIRSLKLHKQPLVLHSTAEGCRTCSCWTLPGSVRDTPPIIRSLKLHKQPLVLHNTAEGCRTCSCWTLSGSVCDTPPIIRSLKLHKQPLVLHNTVGVCRMCSCWTLSRSVRYLTTSNNYTSDSLLRYYAKPEAAFAVLGSWWWAVCLRKHVELHLNRE
jgi:hypothetical protein